MMIQRDVYKFGGSSQKDAAALENCIDLLVRDDHPKAVIVSAPSEVTNLLIAGAEKHFDGEKVPQEFYRMKQRYMDIFHRIPGAVQVIDEKYESLLRNAFGSKTKFSLEQQPFHYTYIVSFGERLEERLFPLHLRLHGLPAKTIPARHIFKLSGDSRNATYNRRSDALIQEAYANPDILPITGGFHGSDEQGNVLLFSRGGSDYTQTLVARAIHARACYNCTDVPGIYPIDPKLFSADERQQLEREGKLRPIPFLSYQEAQELAKQGAKVIHPQALDVLVDDEITFYVLNTFAPGAGMTEIGSLKDPTPRVTGITGKKGPFHSISLRSGEMEDSSGYLSFVGEAFSGVNVETITTSRVGIGVGFSDPKADLERLTSHLAQRGRVEQHNDSSFIALVGINLGKDPNILAQFFSTLAREKIPVGQVSKMSSNFSSEGTSADFSLWAEVPAKDYERAQKALYFSMVLREPHLSNFSI